MSSSANRTFIGLFFIGGLALFIAFLIALGGGMFSGNRPSAIAYFNQDVSGLDTGSPVRLRGVTIGKVNSILLRAGKQSDEDRAVPVIIEFDPSLARKLGAGEILGTQEGVESAIKGGLVAKLKLQSFVTGVLYVDLDYLDAGAQKVRHTDAVPQIPTALSDHVAFSKAFARTVENISTIDFKGISERLNGLITSVNRIADDPALAQATKDLSIAMATFNRVSEKLGEQIAPLAEDLKSTSGEARKTLVKLGLAADHLQDLTRQGGASRTQLDQAVTDFSEAAQSVKSLADYLDRHPEALLKGKRKAEPEESK
jgi:paraquat-inducible protein B